MATFAPNSEVTIGAPWLELLNFAPPSAAVVVVVHPQALKAPDNPLTLVAHLGLGEVGWVGAVDEGWLDFLGAATTRDGRHRVAARLLTGARLWDVLTPGYLLNREPGVATCTYGGSRPWLVVGELADGHLLALPLSDASGQEKWYAPHIERSALPTLNPKPSQLELAHLWSFPGTCHVVGALAARARPVLERALRKYYR